MAPVGKYFQIKSKLNGLMMDVQGGSTNVGTPVLLWNKHDGENQVWYEDPLTGTIRSRHSHLCIEINANNRLVINIYKPGDNNQQWRYNREKSTIENRANPVLVLDVVGASKSAGAEVCAYETHGKDNQQWKLESLPIRYFYIRSELCNKVLDIQGAKSSPGAKIILYAQKSGKADNQLWFEDAQGNIRSKLSEKLVLDGSGSAFHTSHYTEGNTRQFWMVSGNRIVNKYNHNEVADIKEAKTSDDAEIVVWKYHGASNQHWHFDYTN